LVFKTVLYKNSLKIKNQINKWTRTFYTISKRLSTPKTNPNNILCSQKVTPIPSLIIAHIIALLIPPYNFPTIPFRNSSKIPENFPLISLIPPSNPPHFPLYPFSVPQAANCSPTASNPRSCSA
jgi:hypothetical protein